MTKLTKIVHIDLTEHGFETQWVDVRDPRFLSMRTLDRWQAGVKDGTLDNERFVREFVAAWHLQDADSGVEMNDPANDDIGGLSIAIFKAISENMQRLFRGSTSLAGGGGPDGSLPYGDPGGAEPPG